MRVVKIRDVNYKLSRNHLQELSAPHNKGFTYTYFYQNYVVSVIYYEDSCLILRFRIKDREYYRMLEIEGEAKQIQISNHCRKFIHESLRKHDERNSF